MKYVTYLFCLVCIFLSPSSFSGEVTIVSAELKNTGGRLWTVSVTLTHTDTGWAHYADRWRVVDTQGNVISERVLHHPHVNEQPFTRSLYQVDITHDTTLIYIEAHDSEHGWNDEKLKINLNKVKNDVLTVRP